MARALGQHVEAPSTTNALVQRAEGTSTPTLPARKFFSKTITNATCDLPPAVIKELKAGFKNYIPLAMCTHKACSNATRTTDAFDIEIGLSDKGEIKTKQKSMSAAKDYYLTTDDLTEVHENFIRGMRKYLVMDDLEGDLGPGGERATACADMFADFFSIVVARPDFTRDWPSYRGYIIESYMSWVGRRDDSYGLIFDEALFYKHKMSHLVPVILEQLRQPLAGSGSAVSARGSPGMRGRGRGSFTRGGFPAHSFPSSSQSQPPVPTYRCYLCAGTHSHREHQGPATRLVTNELGKWVDKAFGSKIICISFNVGSGSCKRGTSCIYHHSCSLCGDASHGSANCGA